MDPSDDAASPFLIVLGRDMSIKLQLERALIFVPVGSMTKALRPEQDAGTRAASGLYGNVAQPFRHANRGLLHRPFTFLGLAFAGVKRHVIVSGS